MGLSKLASNRQACFDKLSTTVKDQAAAADTSVMLRKASHHF
jgi:hypothetical protein